MIKYALASGLKIPSSLAQKLAATTVRKQPPNAEPAGQGPNHQTQLIPPETGIRDLFWIHGQLAAVVAPATPRSIHATEPSAEGGWTPLGSIRLLRGMMMVAGLCLVVFVATGALTHGGPESNATATGLTIVWIQLHFLAAAGLGASFFALYQAKRYVNESTFDPRFEPTYWIRFTLGLIAGAILANFIEIDLSDAVGQAFEKATIAMLGGFSADAVYRLLNRLVDSISTLVRGETRDLLAAQEASLKSQLAEEAGQERLTMAADLVRLRENLRSGASPDQLSKALARIIEKVVPPSSPDEEK